VPRSPVRGMVLEADGERGRLAIASDDGAVLQLEGVRPALAARSRVDAGDAVGTLDSRGVLVTRALRPAASGGLVPVPTLGALSPAAVVDPRLARVVESRRELLRWLGGRDEVRPRPPVSGRGPT
jgi:hypothetical protein